MIWILVRWLMTIIFSVLSLILTVQVVRHWRRGDFEIGDVISLLGICVSVLIAVIVSPLTLATPPEPVPPTVIATPTERGARATTMLPLTLTETPQTALPTSTPMPTTTATTENTATLTQVPIAPTPTETIQVEPSPLPTATPTLLPTPNPSPTRTVPPVAPTATATLQPTSTQTLSPTVATPVVTTGDLHIHVEGFGIAQDTATNPAQRERSALLAAEVDAKRKLAEWLTGAEIEAVTIVDQGVVTTDIIRQTVKATVPASQVIAQHYDSETGTATVTLDLVIDKASLP